MRTSYAWSHTWCTAAMVYFIHIGSPSTQKLREEPTVSHQKTTLGAWWRVSILHNFGWPSGAVKWVSRADLAGWIKLPKLDFDNFETSKPWAALLVEGVRTKLGKIPLALCFDLAPVCPWLYQCCICKAGSRSNQFTSKCIVLNVGQRWAIYLFIGPQCRTIANSDVPVGIIMNKFIWPTNHILTTFTHHVLTTYQQINLFTIIYCPCWPGTTIAQLKLDTWLCNYTLQYYNTQGLGSSLEDSQDGHEMQHNAQLSNPCCLLHWYPSITKYF